MGAWTIMRYGGTNEEILKEAINDVIDRHETLRMQFNECPKLLYLCQDPSVFTMTSIPVIQRWWQNIRESVSVSPIYNNNPLNLTNL